MYWDYVGSRSIHPRYIHANFFFPLTIVIKIHYSYFNPYFLKCLVMLLDFRHAGEVFLKIDDMCCDFITASFDNLVIGGL